LREPITRRTQDQNTASEANLDVLKYQVERAEALTTAEKDIAITCENTESFDVDTVVHTIRETVKVVY